MSDRPTKTSPWMIVFSLVATPVLIWMALAPGGSSSILLAGITWLLIALNVVFLASLLFRRK